MDNPAPADPDAIYRRPAASMPPTLPSISDYWPDAPHRIGPPADHYTDEPTDAAVDALLRSGTRDRVPPNGAPGTDRDRFPQNGAPGADGARGTGVSGNDRFPQNGTRGNEGARDRLPRAGGPGNDRAHGHDGSRAGHGSGAAAPPPGRRSRRSALPALALAAVLVAGAGVAGVVLTRGDRAPVAAPPPVGRTTRPAPAQTAPAQIIEPRTTPPSAAPAPANVISAPARGRERATFELVSDTAVIDLRAGDTGADLYRITTPQDGSVLPRAQVNPAGVRLFLDEKGERGDAAVTVLLNAEVRWRLRVTGGIKAGVFDLGAAEVEGMDFAGDAARIDLKLPRPDGTLPIRLSGGVNRFEVSADRGVPVRVRARGGAGQVKLDGRTDDGVARGASFLSPDWAGSRNRIDLDAVVGVGTLRVGRG
ncbi:hypothetical protein GCM10020358_36410 [Amorphoplanes nipponensis]|uniref:Uncharacterized protein n=1 Tax=Actinoplanes nipponensis TaxID=135950 RepID=A0A919JG21_9ACTN|nr:hypothetical protein [Actinoplanes nipponensis]GIE48998.1 hypothetical protein Ani05nite_25320 [Actinoplanes nipponensis]